MVCVGWSGSRHPANSDKDGCLWRFVTVEPHIFSLEVLPGNYASSEKTLRQSAKPEKEIAFLVGAKKFQNCHLALMHVEIRFGSRAGDGKSFSMLFWAPW
jgi:hypothetical protein